MAVAHSQAWFWLEWGQREALRKRVGLQLKQKLLLALTAYVALGFLAWQTLSDEPIGIGGVHASLRTLTLVILGIFAFRTLMGYWRLRTEEHDATRKQ